jgi:hypothetical protein
MYRIDELYDQFKDIRTIEDILGNDSFVFE